MEIINYSKEFNTFEEGLKELLELVPDVYTYIKGEEGMSENDVIHQLMKKFTENLPVSTNPNFPYTYSFEANRFGVNFGTDKRIRFGWVHKIYPEREFYRFNLVVPNAPIKSSYERDLIDNEWTSRALEIGKHKNKKKTAKQPEVTE